MIIDKTNKITKILAVICAVCAVLGSVLTIRGFVFYRLIVTLANAALAFVFFKGIGKDKEICVGIFGTLAVFEVVRVFMEESMNLSSGIFMLLRILGYVALVAYFMGFTKNKVIPIVGGSIVSLLMVKNVYNLLIAYKNWQTVLGGKGLKLSATFVLDMMGVVTYIVPTLVITILIAIGAIKFIEK